MSGLARSTAFVLAAVLVFLPATALRAEKAASDAQASILRHLPADTTSVMLVPDPLPHLKSLLTHPDLRRVLTEGKLAELVRQAPDGPDSLDPQQGWEAIQANERFVPVQVAVAASDETVSKLDHLVRAAVLSALCWGAVETGGDALKNELPKLQEELLAELKQAGLPPLVLWVEMREQGVAEQAQVLARGAVRNAVSEWDLSFREEESGFSVRGRVHDILPEIAFPAVLDQMGAIASVEDPKALPLAKAVAGIRFEFGMEQLGAGLRFWMGPKPDTRQEHLGPAALGPLFRESPRDIAFFRANVRAMRSAVGGWVKLWKAWENTRIGREVAKADEEDSLDDLRLIQRGLRGIGETASGRVSSGKGALEGVAWYEGAPEAPPLTESSLLELVPGDAEIVMLDATSSLGDMASDLASSFEDRLATKSFQWELSGRYDKAGMAEMISRHYYRDFAGFREEVHEKAPRAFEPPCAVIATTTGRIERLRVRVAAADVDLVMDELPMFELAAIGRMMPEKAARQSVQRIYTELVRGLFAVSGSKVPAAPELRLLRQQDLGLGVPTFVFEAGWVRELADGDEVAVTAQGDLRPHLFLAGEYLVLSTSPRLSRRLVGAGRGDPKRWLPEPADGKLVAYGRVPGESIGRLYGQLFEWVASGAKAAGEDPGTMGPLMAIGGIQEFCEMVDRIEWQTAQQAAGQRTEWWVRFNSGAR